MPIETTSAHRASPLTATVTHSESCLNCGTPLTGVFCSACGQRDIPPYPSTRELVIDAFWELSGWDGRFASTVRELVRRPGMLTREFLEGRRARYLSPLRLYLLASLAYFLLAAATPNVARTNGRDGGFAVNSTVSRPERVANAASSSLRQEDISPADRAEALKSVEKAPPVMRPFLRKAISDPRGFRRGILEDMPRLLFGLLPVFALIVAVFYRGRKYPEHLYFAVHLHAFMFAALCVAELAKFTRVAPLVIGTAILSLCWIPVYATLAFKRVYGGSIATTLLKEMAIGAIYGVIALVSLVGLVYWVSLGV